MFNDNKKNFYNLLLYSLGIIHLIFFFFFVDYYNYTDEKIPDKASVIAHKKIQAQYINENKIVFNSANSLQSIAEKILDRDKTLFKEIITNFKVDSLFQYKEFTNGDWENEHKAQKVLEYSFNNLVIPYHSMHHVGQRPINDRWLGNGFVSFSPQIVLLSIFNSQTFTFINLLLMYSIGFIGCLLIKQKYKLDNIPFTFLFIIFNFNGYFVEKIANYAPHFLGYYILPYIFYILLKINDHDTEDKKIQIKEGILLGIGLAFIFMQGSLNLYSITLSFVIFFIIFNYKYWFFGLIGIMLNFLICSVKLLPASLAYGTKGNHHYWEWGGYANLEFFFRNVIYPGNNYEPSNSHEWSLYISLPGLLLISYFAFWAPFINEKWIKYKLWRKFLIPTIILFIISFRHLKHFFIPHWIPLLNSESLTARYMIIPLLVVTILATINLQSFLIYYKHLTKIKLLMITWLVLILLLLSNHSRIWRMHQTQTNTDWHYVLHNMNPPNINNLEMVFSFQDINIYYFSFWFGLFISIISLIVSLWFLKSKKLNNN